MKNSILLSILFLLPFLAFSQNKGIRILPEAGLSNPIGDFKAENVFAKRGYQFGLHLEKMWGKFGLGIYGGMDMNDIQFDDLLPAGNSGLSLTKSENIVQYQWKQFLAAAGPVLKLDLSKKINIELTSKLGLAKFSYPDFGKFLEVGAPLNQEYVLYQTKNETIEQKLNPVLFSALRINFKLAKRVDLSLSGNYKYVKDVLHSYSFLNAEFTPDMSNDALIQTLRTAPTYAEVRKCDFNSFGVAVGLSFIFGKDKPKDKMDPPVPDYPENGAIITTQEADSLTLEWLKEKPNVNKANYNLWLYQVREAGDQPDSLIYQTKIKRSLEALLPEEIKLNSGASYKWKVQAVDDSALKACLEGCYSVEAEFRVSGSSIECILKKKLDAGFYTLVNGSLNFKFEEEYLNNGNELEFNIFDKNRVIVLSNTSPGINVKVTYKDNRCRLNLKALNPSLPQGFYILEVKDKKGEISMLRFKL